MESLNVETFGKRGIKNILSEYLSDLSSYRYLFRHRRFDDLRSFWYTKHLAPTGEGTKRWLFNPLIRRLALVSPNAFGLPKSIEVETTTLCNKKCVMCEWTYWKQGEQEKRHLSFDEFKHIVDMFPSLRWVNMTGEGSAFLNRDYPRMLRYLHDIKKASIWLVDHLDDVSFRFLYENVLHYVHGIYVSMDGATKETYGDIKKGCNYDAVMHNIKEIIRFKKNFNSPFPHLALRYIIMKQNLHEIPEFVDLINSIAPSELWGGSSSRIEFTGLLSFPEIEKYNVEKVPEDILDELKKRKNNGGIDFVFQHPEQKRNPPSYFCTAWLEPYIMLPGYVLPCCAVLMENKRKHLRECSFGNLFKTSAKDIWHSIKFNLFREYLTNPFAPLPEICVGCRAYQTEDRVKKYGVWGMKTC